MTASVPQLLKVITFTLGGSTSFKEDMVSLAVVPVDADGKTILTLDGISHGQVQAANWRLQGTCVIDWDTVRPGFAYYAKLHEGESVACVFNANTTALSTTNPGLTFNVRVSPVQYGGEGNDYATADFDWVIDGAITVDTTP